MAFKKFIAIHTYHSEETKKKFWSGVSDNMTTDIEWVKKWDFEKAKCSATWVGADDFFFCQWEAENPEDVLSTIAAQGFDEFIFTAMYQIDMHIDANNLTGKIPYRSVLYLDSD